MELFITMGYIKLIITSLFILTFGVVQGQSLKIDGVVTDSRTGNALIGANAFTSNSGTVTDIEGRFSLVVEQGDSITVSYVSYKEVVYSFQYLQNVQLPITIELQYSENILSTATITGSKYEQRLSEATVSVEVIKPELIKSTNTVNIDQVLDKVPGVQMIDGQANIRGGSGYSYGAGSRVMLLIDDMPALQSDAGFPNWGDIPIEIFLTLKS